MAERVPSLTDPMVLCGRNMTVGDLYRAWHASRSLRDVCDALGFPADRATRNNLKTRVSQHRERGLFYRLLPVGHPKQRDERQIEMIAA